MEFCTHCGEVIVRDEDQWMTVEGTLYCVLNHANGHHVPAVGRPTQRVVDVRETPTADHRQN
jgi:hypothetical protein